MSGEKSVSGALFIKAESLKSVLSSSDSKKRKFLDDLLVSAEHQELQTIYENLILTDLSYALEKKVEIDLWNFCFKDLISLLQGQSQSSISSKNSTSQSDVKLKLNCFLDFASGFYFLLLEKLRAQYDLDLPFLKSGTCYGLSSSIDQPPSTNNLKNVNYILENCLVHLGDLARYQNRSKQAAIFYHQAIQIAPAHGQAYNQIGLLESLHSKPENKLKAVFYYIRSLAVKHPFPASASNLSRFYSRLELRVETKSVNDVSTFLTIFLRFHALIHRTSHLRDSALLVGQMSDALMSLVAAEKITDTQLNYIVAVTLFAIDHHIPEESRSPQASQIDENKLAHEEVATLRILSDFLAAMLNAFLLPVYTFQQGESMLEYFALPAAKLVLNYLQYRPALFTLLGFRRRLQIWPGLCRLLNELSNELDAEIFNSIPSQIRDSYPLPEEHSLQSFLPLKESFESYNFKLVHRCETPDNLIYVRAHRLIKVGRFLASEKFAGPSLLRLKDDSVFEPIEQAAEPAIDLLAGLELETPGSDSEEENRESSPNPEVIAKLKSKNASPGLDSKKRQVSRHNVALNAILNNLNQTESNPDQGGSKQVTFKTPSPSPRYEMGASSQTDQFSQFSLVSQEMTTAGELARKVQPTHPSPLRVPDLSVPPPPIPRPGFSPNFPTVEPNFTNVRPQMFTEAFRPVWPGAPPVAAQTLGSGALGVGYYRPDARLQMPARNTYGEFSLFSQQPVPTGQPQAGRLFGQLQGAIGGPSPLEKLLQRQQSPNRHHQ